ncbi:MAG: hypothetical protein WD100_05805 [Tistlia sp.]|uniref:hypothetical protein n=1 Tax=Tistlia sp. TaxID=3057121 RepID=UPI0034A3BC76
MTQHDGKERRELEEKGERQTRLESDPILGEGQGQPGRAGGNLARKVGTRDEKKRAFERPAGTSRVRKQDEREGE